jgi:nucleoside-diphosphate-sugar epimerase
MAKKILITGATGFVGSNLAKRLLDRNNEVHIIVRENSDLWRINDRISDFNVHNVDLANKDAVRGLARSIDIDIVYHLATYGGFHFQSDIDKILEVNLIGTWNLFKEFSQKGIEMFINTSSSSEYGEKKAPMKEDMRVEPNNMYGSSKAAATILCSTYSQINRLPFVTYRLFSPYGYFDAVSRLIPTVIISCLTNKIIKLGKKDAKRDYVFIDDVINAYLNFDRIQNPYGEIYNVGSGTQYSVEEIANKILLNFDHRNIIEWNNEFKRQYEPNLWVSDNKRIMGELNWKPEVGIEEGLKSTIQWFTDNIGYYI